MYGTKHLAFSFVVCFIMGNTAASGTNANLGGKVADAKSKLEASSNAVQEKLAEVSRLNAQANSGLIDKAVAEKAEQELASLVGEENSCTSALQAAERALADVSEDVAQDASETVADSLGEKVAEQVGETVAEEAGEAAAEEVGEVVFDWF